MDRRVRPVATGSGRSSPERGGVPPKVVEGHGRSRVTYKGQETPRVPLHHASHGPPPPGGGGTAAPPPKPDVRLPKPKAPATILYVEKRPHFSSRSEKPTSAPQSLMRTPHAVLLLKKTTNEYDIQRQ